MFFDAPDSDRNNTLAISMVDPRKGARATFEDDDYPSYSDIWQVLVTYDADYKQVITENSGPQTRFVYLGRLKGSGSWRILSIDTGP